MDDKIQLWAKALPNLTEETCKKHFDELGFPELRGFLQNEITIQRHMKIIAL